MDLQHSKGDLSRRAVYYKIPGLSFREYLNLHLGLDVPAIQFEHLLKQHVQFAEQFHGKTILKQFHGEEKPENRLNTKNKPTLPWMALR